MSNDMNWVFKYKVGKVLEHPFSDVPPLNVFARQVELENGRRAYGYVNHEDDEEIVVLCIREPESHLGWTERDTAYDVDPGDKYWWSFNVYPMPPSPCPMTP